METAVEHALRAIRELPDDLSGDELIALFGGYDELAARLCAGIDRVDPAAYGAVSLVQWLRTFACRSGAEAGAFVRRAARVRLCPEVAAAWLDGRLATAQTDTVVHHVNDRSQPLFADHEAGLVPTLVGLSVRDTE